MRFSLPLAFLSLLMASSLWVAEEAINGQGLHLVVLWFGLLIVAGLRLWQRDGLTVPRWSLADAGVGLLFLGHAVSTLWVFLVQGDRRSAMNLTIEWGGLAAAWCLLRTLVATPSSDGKRMSAAISEMLLAVAVGLACFGLWQHHVFYRQASQEYLAARKELDEALKSNTPGGLSKASQLVAEFRRQGIPLDGPARQLWENRLLHSTEPLGPFALTNTLAGLLASAFVLQAGLLIRLLGNRDRKSLRTIGVWVFQAILLLYCLVLTKSRSAWCGAFVGIVIVLIMRSRAAVIGTTLRWLLTGGFVAGILVVIVGLFGGIDRQVILESPRSLQFRLFYWTGTLEMLAEHPVFGAGPGNFRQLYLPYKAVESSEEIRDPHNIILDAWSSSGLIGLAGFGLLCVCLVRYVRTDGRTSEQTTRFVRTGRLAMWSTIVGFLLHFGWEWVSGRSADFEWPRLLLLSGGLLPLVRGPVAIDGGRGCWIPAAAALLVHLLAAGGFEMPVVMLMLLVFTGLSVSDTVIPTSSAMDSNAELPPLRSGMMVAALGMAGIVVTCLYGLHPVVEADRLLAAAQSDAERFPNSSQVFRSFAESAKADPWAVLPRQRFAETLSYKLRELQYLSRQSENSGDDFRQQLETRASELQEPALSACEDLISVDRRGLSGFLVRSECLQALADILGDRKLLEQAAQNQVVVSQRNPTASDVWLRLAELHQKCGNMESASQAAVRALEIDEINHAWGHQDQYLSADNVRILKALAASP